MHLSLLFHIQTLDICILKLEFVGLKSRTHIYTPRFDNL